MLESFLESEKIKHLEKVLFEEPSLLFEGLWEAPKAFLLYLLAKESKKNLLILQASEEEKLSQDIQFFLGKRALDFPAWETLPGEEIPPNVDIVGKRWETLHAILKAKEPVIVFCPLQAALQKILSPKELSKLCEAWKTGQEIAFDTLPAKLSSLGYQRAPVVADKGQFALRGGIVDIFPPSSPIPYRIDFFGDAIDKIKTFDPISQKSIETVKEMLLTPADEINLLKTQKDLDSILGYLGDDAIIVFDDLLALEDKYVSFKSLPGATSRFFASFQDFFSNTKDLKKIYFSKENLENIEEDISKKREGRSYYAGKTGQGISLEICGESFQTKKMAHPFHEISDFFSSSENIAAATQDEILHNLSGHASQCSQLQFICSTESEKNLLLQSLEANNTSLPKNTKFNLGYLSSGFVIEEPLMVLLPFTEFTHRYKIRRQKWRSTYHTPPSEFHELSIGDLVVHFHHGIGKYLGIEKRPNHTGALSEFLVIEYAEGSKFYTPVSQSHLVSRYIGSKEEVPVLHTLGNQKWQKTRLQAQKSIIGYAQDLLNMQASRTIKGGFTFKEDGEELRFFEDDFPFIETDDQLGAIHDVKSDMMSNKAMDRLVCGDVGYGKTEVAMRAAFKAVTDGKKQVAVLVPTTILSMQHAETFKQRMANFKIRIEALSRAKTPKETKKILEDLASGKIDIIIGTHRLISSDIIFHDLGLIIIDEEQRFGVRAKEHLKAIKTGVDCLTLSATPIPRTLYLSLVGGKDISIIHTPPQDRLPIKSILAEKEASLIQNALLRELSRDGQAYYIHNRVETIYQISEEIQKLVPEARILTGHGQMSPDEIEMIFQAFKEGQADILIATTIVENGIDIPNANTILIENSERFGMADLYQLRGRVGRWNRPAYAYFLIPKHRSLPESSKKRLQALVETSGYGGGMKIAMRDLEIRGAGDILGTKQSGQISAIGFHLYCKLLKKTVDAMHNKATFDFFETKMEFAYDARLPEDYINETSLRLEIYHRLGEAESFNDAEEIFSEMQDRFGKPPLPVLWLYHLARIRIFAAKHRFSLLKFQSYTFLVEKQKGKKEKIQKTLALPKTQKPDIFEKEVIAILQKSF